MHGPREVLNELKWRESALDDSVLVWYVHRGALNDARAVKGSDVVGLHASFMEIRSTERSSMIPYHRVFLVERDGREVWRRRATDSSPRPA